MTGARFVCLSDVDVPCERVPIEKGWPGWWSKIELFDHFRGRTLYLDLDSTLLRDPSYLATGSFRMPRNWLAPERFCSGVMYWTGDYSHITRAFEPIADEVMASYVIEAKWGDEAFIAEHAGEIEAFPDSIASWRYQISRRGGTIPKGTVIVAFNGVCPPWRGPWWARKWYVSST